MNARLVIRILGSIELVEAASFIPSIIVSLIYKDGDTWALVITMAIVLAVSLPMFFLSKPRDRSLRSREGFLVVALSWIILSIFGAIPFSLSGLMPTFVDSLFESVSGFTTTGATVLRSFDHTPHGIMFWRSFTHWIGGMGVLVLTLALIPKLADRSSHLIRAESPGPSLSKLVPRIGDSSKILYLIYMGLTCLEFVVLLLLGMNAYDAGIHALGTAGTGGFSNYGDSVAHFQSTGIDIAMTVFMCLFGVNFAVYYFFCHGQWKDIFHNEELRWYLSIFFLFILAITIILIPTYGNFFTALRYSSFQTASIMSTSGFSTTDFDLWPVQAKMLLMVLLFFGSCAGSTAGGIKIVRIALLIKEGAREIRHTFQPRKVQTIRLDGHGVDESMLHSIAVFSFIYVALILAGSILLSLEGKYDLITNFTASLTCVSNVGPGYGAVGPAGSFAGYGPFAKLCCCFLMLAGRLELYPLFVIFHPAVWKRT